MQELKFKALCVADGETKMVYFGMQEFDNRIAAWPMPDNISHIDEYLSPLLQYIGIEDANGIKIYKGDFVREVYNNKMYGQVVFRNGCFGYILAGQNNKDFNKGEFIQIRTVEIIGNVYLNPELLTNQK